MEPGGLIPHSQGLFNNPYPFKETEVTSTPTRPVYNVVIATKGLQDRNTNIIAGTTVENKGKLILTIEVRYSITQVTLYHIQSSLNGQMYLKRNNF